MDSKDQAKAFFAKSKSDHALSGKILKILGDHGKATASEILALAREAGFEFTQQDFEHVGMQNIEAKFAVDTNSAERSEASGPLAATKAPESACSRGCLSYTHNWHPDPIFR